MRSSSESFLLIGTIPGVTFVCPAQTRHPQLYLLPFPCLQWSQAMYGSSNSVWFTNNVWYVQKSPNGFDVVGYIIVEKVVLIDVELLGLITCR